jgi:apolipoprotein N-acyltransferase
VTTANRLLLALATGVLYALAEPPHDRALFGFVALVPLLVALYGTRRALAAAGLGWVAGTTAASLLVSSSVAEAGTRYFGAPPTTAWLAGALAPQLYAAPYFAGFAWLAHRMLHRRRSPVVIALGIAAAWVACDLARARVGDGCPWVLLAHSQHAHPVWLQVADLGGASIVSFVLALSSAALAVVLVVVREGGRDGVRALGGLVVLVTAVIGGARLYGDVRLARWSRPPRDGTVRVAALQPHDVPLPAPDLVVWPENAISIAPDAITTLARAGAVPRGATLLVGAPRIEQTAPGRAVLHNSAYLVDDAGAIRPVYDKQSLTPWAETAPWPLTWVPGAWPPAPGDYTPGAASAELPRVDDRPFGVVICSEAVYAGLVRAQVRAGATFLVNLANDAWFGGHPAVVQHAAAALLRAVETRRTLVRATTTGISAIVAPSGEVVAQAADGVAAALVADVPVLDGTTLYVRVGDLFAWVCVAFALGAALLPPARS